MSLNLITDRWIPVKCVGGQTRLIAPWQMGDQDLLAPNWPRPDLNIGCLELMIGLVFLADPPTSPKDWRERTVADPDRLQEKLLKFEPAFRLLGAGPLFMQDLELLDGPPNKPDMLFIDSAGANTAKNNADLMVHRERYDVLDPGLAAIALHTFQNFAPSGGAGNRTSMRGGGPLVTLVDPGGSLWDLIWANVPYGAEADLNELPWMRPTRVSDKGQETLPPDGKSYNAETFFGMPRRLRLVSDERGIIGVIQKPSGNNYAKWIHPLSPYYRLKEGAVWLPKHPPADRFSYNNWLGVVAQSKKEGNTKLALTLWNWHQRGSGDTQVIVAGWSMDNMKPRDFTLSVPPLLDLPIEQEDILIGLIQAASAAYSALKHALGAVIANGTAPEAQRDTFFSVTEVQLLAHIQTLRTGGDPRSQWLQDLKKQGLNQFNALAMPGLDQRETDEIQKIVQARGQLTAAYAGHGKLGQELFHQLSMELPVPKPKKRGKT